MILLEVVVNLFTRTRFRIRSVTSARQACRKIAVLSLNRSERQLACEGLYRHRHRHRHRYRHRHCPPCRTYEIATRFWEVVICPIYMCLTVYEFSFILFDLCLFITIFNFVLNYVLIVTFWIFTYYKIWIMLIIYCFIWNYWIFYFVTCLEVFWSVMG